MEEVKNKMGVKPIFPLLMSMALPPMVSMFIQSMYNIIDSIFVARISQDALTAVSLAFPVQNLLLAAAVGLGVGVNSYVSRKLGEKQFENANSAVTHGLLLSLIHAAIFIFAGILFIDPFFRLFTADDSIFQMSRDYTRIVVFFAFGTLIHIAIEKSFQATGKMIFPMLLQAFGAIVNIILDPILIFGLFGMPALGVKGAAIATVIGQISSMLLSALVLFTLKHDIKVQFRDFHPDFSVIKEIYSVGVPSMLMTSLGSVLVMGLNGILISFSNMAVSVFGIYFKLQTFVFMPVSGLVQGTMPILGYNYGANNKKRMLKTLKISLSVAISIMTIGCILFQIFPEFFLTLFDAEEEMLSMGVTVLRIISFSYIPASFGILFATLFQAMAKGSYSLIIFLLRQIVIILPLSYFLSIPFGLVGVWISFPIAEIVGLAVALWLYHKVKKQDPIFKLDET